MEVTKKGTCSQLHLSSTRLVLELLVEAATDNETARKSLAEEIYQLVQLESITGETSQRQDPRQKASREPFVVKEASIPTGWHLNAIAMSDCGICLKNIQHFVRARPGAARAFERLCRG